MCLNGGTDYSEPLLPFLFFHPALFLFLQTAAFFFLTSEKQQSVAHRSILTFILQPVRPGLLLLHFE